MMDMDVVFCGVPVRGTKVETANNAIETVMRNAFLSCHRVALINGSLNGKGLTFEKGRLFLRLVDYVPMFSDKCLGISIKPWRM